MAIAVTVKNPNALRKTTINSKEQKRKGWSTPYGFIDADKPVTYNEALRMGAELENRLNDIKSEKKDV
jgi:hypothetical protein